MNYMITKYTVQPGKKWLLLIVLITLVLTGCQTSGKKWGAGATVTPGWSRIKRAAINAAKDPITWTHAAAAVAVYASGHDKDWAEKMYKSKPVFGDNAAEKTDEYRDILNWGRIGVALLTPSGDSSGEWLLNKTKGLAVEAVAMSATGNITSTLKSTVGRKAPIFNPYVNNTKSFTSAHATEPFASAALIRRDLRYIDIPEWGKHTINIAAYSLAAGSAVGRIEMGLHHPSDQLAGAAIGNFIAIFFHDAFLGSDSPVFVSIEQRDDVITGQISVGIK